MLKEKFAYGNNGIRKTKLLTLSVQASNEREARLKLGGLETDAVNNLKLLGASARVLNGRQRLKILFDMMHPEGERFDFEWKYLPESGLSTKDFIVPSSLSFGKSRQFSMGDHICRASYLQILAPKIDDRILKKFLDMPVSQITITRCSDGKRTSRRRLPMKNGTIGSAKHCRIFPSSSMCWTAIWRPVPKKRSTL